ncbi:MAG TPA: YtxH domain-containing protein [Ignavibacteriaceae bacterium]|nr:YtxH domain-containing protein [Ignavibacteriaceae bacterium]
MSKENGFGKGLLMGFLAGGAVGAIFALLYAPKSGKELRNDIRSKADEYLDEAEKYLEEARDRAKMMINEGKKKSEKLISDARIKSDELMKDAEKIFTDAKSKVGQAVNTGKQTLENEKNNLKNAFKAGVEAYKETKQSS